MSELRKIMNAVLKETFIPKLREVGFKGSFPHFRRAREEQIDLLTFQFGSAGGKFVVELAKADPAGLTTTWCKHIPPAKVKAHDVTFRQRHRLGSPLKRPGDHWFVFAPPYYGPLSVEKPEALRKRCLKVAFEVIKQFEKQADTWWNDPTTGLPTE